MLSVCAALADDSRVRVVELLAHRDLSAGEIADHFTVSRPAVSKHLKVLREAGLVTVRPEANRRVYQLNVGPLDELTAWAAEQRAVWERRLDALGAHLDAKARSTPGARTDKETT